MSIKIEHYKEPEGYKITLPKRHRDCEMTELNFLFLPIQEFLELKKKHLLIYN